MASKPRRRRHNRHNLSYISGMKSNGEIEKIPRSRKAFKVFMRDERLAVSKDLIKIKNATEGLAIGGMIYLSANELLLNNRELQGYYSRNSKGPVKLTGYLIDQAKKVNRGEAHAS